MATQSAAPKPAMQPAAQASPAANRRSAVSEILRSYSARKAARARADAERLAAIDFGAEPCAWKALLARAVKIPLRLQPDLPPFARFHRGVFAAKLEQGSRPAATVMSDAGGIVLHAVVALPDLGFYPARPLTLNGFVRLHASAELAVSRAEDAQLDVSYRLFDYPGLRVDPARVSARVPCSDVALVEQREAFERRSEGGAAGTLLKSSAITLRSTPGGRVIARLAIEEHVGVTVLEQRGDQVQIELPRLDDTIFGWVPSLALRQDGLGYLTCHGCGHIDEGGHTPSIDETARCSTDVPLSIEQGSKRRQVGLIRAGTTFRLVGTHAGSVSVDFYRDAGLQREPGAAFAIDETMLKSCRVRTPPRLSER